MPYHTLPPWLLALALVLVFGLAALAHGSMTTDRTPARALVRVDRPSGR